MSDFLNDVDPKSLANKVRELEQRLAALEQRPLRADSLDQLSADLGTLRQGELLSADSGQPDDGDYTGLFWKHSGYSFTINGVDYTLLFGSIKNGVVQVAIADEEGTLIAGTGVVTIDEHGITIVGGYDISIPENTVSPSVIDFTDPVSGVLRGQIYVLGDGEVIIRGRMNSNGGNGTSHAEFGVDEVDVNTDALIAQTRIELDHYDFLGDEYGSVAIRGTAKVYFTFYTDGPNKGLLEITADATSGVSSGTGTVKMHGSTNRNSTGWMKILVDGGARYIPYWTTITG